MSRDRSGLVQRGARAAIARYGLVSAAGHLVWEFVHLPLYSIWVEDRRAALFAAVHCWLGDLLIAGGALAVALVLAGRNWPANSPSRMLVAAITIVAGVLFTIASEVWNVQYAGTWAYAKAMPVVVGVGLSPLMQWIVVPGLALAMAMRTRS